MTNEEFKSLKVGDIVRGRADGVGYVVTGNYGKYVTLVRTVEMSNPDEWDLIVSMNTDPIKLLIGNADAS